MGIMDFPSPPAEKAAGTEALIAEMEASLERLRAERREAEQIVEAHAPKRTTMLLSDASEEAILDVDRQADIARLRLERLELVELELADRIDRARDKHARDKHAAKLEYAADEVATKAKRLEGAIKGLAAIYLDLVAAIPNNELDIDITLSERASGRAIASGEEIANAIVAQGLAIAAPGLFESIPQGGRRDPWACQGKLRALRLRQFAAGAFSLSSHAHLTDEQWRRQFGEGAHRLIINVDGDGLLYADIYPREMERPNILPPVLAAASIVVEPLRRRAAALRNGTGAEDETESRDAAK